MLIKKFFLSNCQISFVFVAALMSVSWKKMQSLKNNSEKNMLSLETSCLMSDQKSVVAQGFRRIME